MIVLVAEDNALIGFMIEDVLTEGGHTVLGPACSAVAALRLVEETKPELALIDIELEGERSGIALARELRDRWNVPALFASGQMTMAREHSDAALGVLAKPFSPAVVVKSIDAMSRLFRNEAAVDVPIELELFSGNR